MEDKIKKTLLKVYELINRGSDGEKEAAKAAFDRIVAKYNLDDIDISSLNKEVVLIRYYNNLEKVIAKRVILCFVDRDDAFVGAFQTTVDSKKILGVMLTDMEKVVVECAFGYFRKHMREQYKTNCVPQIKKIKRKKGKRARAEELKLLFLQRYCIASKLYKEHELETIHPMDLSDDEYADHMRMSGVKGGQYRTQVATGNRLSSGN